MPTNINQRPRTVSAIISILSAVLFSIMFSVQTIHQAGWDVRQAIRVHHASESRAFRQGVIKSGGRARRKRSFHDLLETHLLGSGSVRAAAPQSPISLVVSRRVFPCLLPGCNDGRVVADVIRLGKGHTEGLEPNVTENSSLSSCSLRRDESILQQGHPVRPWYPDSASTLTPVR